MLKAFSRKSGPGRSKTSKNCLQGLFPSPLPVMEVTTVLSLVSENRKRRRGMLLARDWVRLFGVCLTTSKSVALLAPKPAGAQHVAVPKQRGYQSMISMLLICSMKSGASVE